MANERASAARSCLTWGRIGSTILLSSVLANVQADGPRDSAWRFAVAGDSRNCGDVVMPAIAADAQANHAAFYWHLGDLRAIYDFNEDFKQLHPNARIAEYLGTAIRFEFRELTESSVPGSVVERSGNDFVHRCYEGNAQP